MADVVTLGETMGLVTGTEIGPLSLGSSMRLGFAGAESNVAIGLARLGHSVAWVGRVGDDEIGTLILGHLRGEGVDVGCAAVEHDCPTGLILKERRTAGRLRVTYYRRGLAGSRLCASDVPESLVSSARILHVTGITAALGDSARAAVHRAVGAARAAGVMVSLDLNYRARLWSRTEAAVELTGLVCGADIVFAGLDEAGLVVPAPDAAAAARALSRRGPSEVVVTLGDHGAVSLVEGSVLEGPAVPVTCVDPVGAGDAFVAGYLSGLLDGLDPSTRLARALTVGAFAVTVPGDWEGLPRRSELGLLGETPDVVR